MHNLISKDIRLVSLTNIPQDSGSWFHRNTQLKIAIAKWQKIFQSYQPGPNPTIGIVHHIDFEYFAMVYAALGLGYNFVTLDHRFDNESFHKDLLPLDFVVYDHLVHQTDSIEYWITNAKHCINAGQVPDTGPDQIEGQTDLVGLEFDWSQFNMLTAVTSGSTSAPKKILHNYRYFIDVATRNARVLNFKGKAAHIRNLHHGSSLPVFFLPAVMSCDLHLCLPGFNTHKVLPQQEFCKIANCIEYMDINHVMFPSPDLLLQFLKIVKHHNMHFTDLKLYTLQYIDPDLKEYIRDKNIEVISIFGCTELSGPIMINSLCNDNIDTFDPKIFYLLDDFFCIQLTDHGTEIESKSGLVKHFMHDQFEKVGAASYRHLGRSNVHNISGAVIDQPTLEKIPKVLNFDGQLIVDTNQQTLYLAVWNQDDCKKIQDSVNIELEKMFGVKVSAAANLNKTDFVSGIKLNQEQVRNYFRKLKNHVKI